MRRIITNYRYYVLLALALVAFFGILSVPGEDTTTWRFLALLLLSKTIGAAAMLGLVALLGKWTKEGSIDEINNLVKEED